MAIFNLFYLSRVRSTLQPLQIQSENLQFRFAAAAAVAIVFYCKSNLNQLMFLFFLNIDSCFVLSWPKRLIWILIASSTLAKIL